MNLSSGNYIYFISPEPVSQIVLGQLGESVRRNPEGGGGISGQRKG